MNGEAAYLWLLQRCVEEGERKENRTGVDTLVLPPQFFRHNMKDGFPLLTSKRVAKRSMLVELEGFINGVTDKSWYQERKCNIWNEWSNAETRPDGVSAEDHNDLGPIYGFQWRRFGMSHMGPRNSGYHQSEWAVDQLASIVQKLHENPNDRRMVCSAWSPLQHSQMALPPCHCMWNLSHVNGVLNLHWHQRSCDLFLGVPFNIASYAMLLTLLCKEVDMEPGQLSAAFCDCHVYVNHLDQIKEQLSRSCRPLPTVEFEKWDGIFDWKHSDVQWKGYNPHPAIAATVAV